MRWTMWIAIGMTAASIGCSGKVQVKVASAPPPPAPKVEPKPAPETEPAKIAYIEISDRIQFEPGRAVLLEKSKKVLDEVVATLTSHPDLELVEIEGHTDWLGSETQNLALSARRAETVSAYLVSKGIAAGRLVPKGYGEMKPIADNTTNEGREANRRVTFRVMKQAGETVPDNSVAGKAADSPPSG